MARGTGAGATRCRKGNSLLPQGGDQNPPRQEVVVPEALQATLQQVAQGITIIQGTLVGGGRGRTPTSSQGGVPPPSPPSTGTSLESSASTEAGSRREATHRPNHEINLFASLTEFRKMKLPTFSGIGASEDPSFFLEEVERLLRPMGCSSERSLELASFQLNGVA